MMGSMLSFDERLDEIVPFYHSLWAYPLLWIGFIFIIVGMILSPIIMLFGAFVEWLSDSNNKFCKKLGVTLGVVIGSPLILGFLCIVPIGKLNEYYKKKEADKNEKRY